MTEALTSPLTPTLSPDGGEGEAPVVPFPAPEPHPFLPWLSDEELAALAVDPDGPEIIRGLLAHREKLLRLAEERSLP